MDISEWVQQRAIKMLKGLEPVSGEAERAEPLQFGEGLRFIHVYKYLV